MGFECDSFPILRNLPQGAGPGGPVFPAHSWLYCRANIGYQATLTGHVAAAFGGETARLEGRPFGRGQSRERLRK